ncbi:MAG: VanZ family protein [Chloroflexota bacterium]
MVESSNDRIPYVEQKAVRSAYNHAMKNNSISSSILRFVWLWLPLLFWAGLIFWFSHQPKVVLTPAQPSSLMPTFYERWQMFWLMPANAELDTVTGKTAHVIVFGILAWLIWRIRPEWKVVLFATMLYGMSDEFHQLFIPGRTGRLWDVFFDCLGALLVVWFLYRRQQRGIEHNKLTPKLNH